MTDTPENPFLKSPALWLRLQLALFERTTGEKPGGIALSVADEAALRVDVGPLIPTEPRPAGEPNLFYGVPLIPVPPAILAGGVPEVMNVSDAELTIEAMAELADPEAALSEPSPTPLFGIDVVLSPSLPLPVSDGARIVRLVRHGFADVLAWLGEDVGPGPDDETHALTIGGKLFVSPVLYEALQGEVVL